MTIGMDTKTAFRLGVRRLAILAAISLAFVWSISEVAFYFQKEDYERAPQEIQLVIPDGTAERVAAGEAVTTIPDKMVFMIGDTLVVKNEDIVDHQLGPLWVPPKSSAKLVMEQAEKYAYSCSFQPSRYLGLDVKKPTTWTTRLTALGLATPATALFLFVYSLIIWPLKPKAAVPEKAPVIARQEETPER